MSKTRRTYLPKSVVEEIEKRAFSGESHEHALRIVSSYLFHLDNSRSMVSDFKLPMSKDYIHDLSSKDFYRYRWKRLHSDFKSNETWVFQSDGYYVPSKDRTGKSLCYHINPELLKSEFVPIDLTLKDGLDLDDQFPKIISHYLSSLEALDVDVQKIESKIESIIHPVEIRKGRIVQFANSFQESWRRYNSSQSYRAYNTYQFDGQEKRFPKSYNIAFFSSMLDGFSEKKSQLLDLILEDDKVVFMTSSDYVKSRIGLKRSIALRKVDHLKKNYGQVSISAKNGRLHSNITSLNSVLLPYCSLDGKSLVALDLKCSQPTILANLLLKKESLKRSIRGSKYSNLKSLTKVLWELDFDSAGLEEFRDFLNENDLYQFIGDELGYSRDVAKSDLWLWLFTSSSVTTKSLNCVGNKFPAFKSALIEVKCAFEKIDSNNNEFSYLLQLTEAHLFVEGVLNKLAEQKIPAFTKHDSILISDDDLHIKAAKEAIEEVFSSCDFEGRIAEERYCLKE